MMKKFSKKENDGFMLNNIDDSLNVKINLSRV